MLISYDKPIDKGVTRLMYVGDDLQPGSRLTLPFVVVVGVVIYLAYFFRAKK